MKYHLQYHLTEYQAPTSEPITLTEAKVFLRIDHNDEDDLINDLIKSVTETAQQYMRRTLIDTQWKILINGCDVVNNGIIHLPMGDIIGVISVKNITLSGTQTFIDSNSYNLNASSQSLIFSDFTSITDDTNIEIIYNAGYVNIPLSIKQGLLMHLLNIYNCRDNNIMPAQSLTSYNPYRNIKI